MFSANVLVGIGLPTFAFFVLRWLLWPKPIQGVPHNPVTSIWGDIMEMGRVKTEKGARFPFFFEPLADRLGPLYQLVIGPLGSILVLSDAQEIEDIMVRRTKSLEMGPFSIDLTGGVVPLSQVALKTDDQWKMHRRVLGPSMSPKYLRFMTPRITSNIDLLIRLWKDKMRIVEQQQGTCFTCEPDFQCCTMDTIGEICFGESFNSLHEAQASLYDQPPELDAHGGATFPHVKTSSLQNAVTYLLNTISQASEIPPQLIRVYYAVMRLTKTWRSNRGALSSLINRRIVDARARAKAMKAHGVVQDMADCVLDMIMEREGREDPDTMTDKEITDELMGFVIAGQDTTSSALSFGVKYLSNHPEVQKKLRHELMEKLDAPVGRYLTYDEVASAEDLPYLEAVVAEILRLASVAVAFQRQVAEDMDILGHTIPKGTSIVFLSSYIGQNSSTGVAEARARKLDPVRSKSSIAHGPSKGQWNEDDVKLFKPERWLVEHEDPVSGVTTARFSSKQGVSTPFGVGPRMCFGAKLATLEMKLFIASLNLAFFFDKVPDALGGFEVKELMVRYPKHAYVALREWYDVLQSD